MSMPQTKQEEHPCCCSELLWPCRYCFYGTATGEPEEPEEQPTTPTMQFLHPAVIAAGCFIWAIIIHLIKAL